MLLFVVALQIVALTCQSISLISSYDEALLKATETVPGLDELTNKIFKSFENLTSLEESNEFVKTLKMAGDAPSWLFESDTASIWNGGTPRTHALSRTANLAAKAYKELVKQDKNVVLSFHKRPPRIPAPFCPKENAIFCNPAYPYRTANGSCNNINYPWWGESESPYKRLLPPEYDDAVSVPRLRSYIPGQFLPNARRVAIVVHKPFKSISEWSNMMLWFGQNVVHDLTLVGSSTQFNGEPKSCKCNSADPDCFNIPIPYEDYHNRDQSCMTFVRSGASLRDFDCNLGPREQLNLMTHWLDLSQTYGPNARTFAKLRLLKGGLLRYSTIPGSNQAFLPLRPKFEECRRSGVRTCKMHQSGDPRAEDNNFLTSMHTIWLREHNRVATELARLNPKWDDETLFQEARRITIAEYQHITYAEYLPVIVGEKVARLYNLLPLESGYFYNYEPGLYPQIANEFSFAMRACHTLIPLELSMANSNYVKYPPKVTGFYLHHNNITFSYPDGPIKGSIRDWSYYPSPQINYDINHYLFDGLFPDSRRFSLPALNIQRTRDHGVPGYNYYRELCGLNYANTFEEFFNVPPYVVQRLKSVYAHPNDVDLWTGMVSEYPVEGGAFGAVAACITAKQFRDLKFGDRFYYENGQDKVTRFTLDQLAQIKISSLARILCDNLDVYFIQQWPLLVANKDWNKLLDCKQIPRINLAPWTDFNKL